jgi:Na+/melibiose symporter-like transporter
LGLFLLGLSGWVEIEATDFADIASQGVAQPESALNMLWIVYTLIPAIGTILGIVVMAFYKMKDKDVELMAKCNGGEITREECEAQLSRKY